MLPETHEAGRRQCAAAHVRAITRAAGSSFYWAMRILPPERREAMFAVYAFCREVDDIADGDEPTARKIALLDEWRGEIGRVFDGSPTYLTAVALVEPARRYALERDDFLAVIDGMAMDVEGVMRAPSLEELFTYCRRVAGAVGLLSIRVFGTGGAEARRFALTLGEALQLTNILRDLAEDAALGRVYLPRELLEAYGVTAREPDAILRDPALPAVCRALAEIARQRFEDAHGLLAACDASSLRPAIVMMMSYRRVLDRLVAAGWTSLDQPVGVSKAEKLWIALRYGIM